MGRGAESSARKLEDNRSSGDRAFGGIHLNGHPDDL
jgi:hypothetical protein